jgi:hypothetical protein
MRPSPELQGPGHNSLDGCSITSSARASRGSGKVRPSTLAAAILTQPRCPRAFLFAAPIPHQAPIAARCSCVVYAPHHEILVVYIKLLKYHVYLTPSIVCALHNIVIDRRYSARAKDRGAPTVATDATNLENVMKNVLFAAATAMMIGAVSPAVATPPEEDTYQGRMPPVRQPGNAMPSRSV